MNETLNNVVNKLKQAATAGELQPFGGCAYTDPYTHRPCALGYLASPELRTKLSTPALNTRGICAVSVDGMYECRRQLIEETGLTISQLSHIQEQFDGSYDVGEFCNKLDRMVAEYDF